VDLLAGRTQGDNLLQEGNEAVAGVARGGFSVHPTSSRLQRGIKRHRAMAVVFEPVALGAAGRKRQNGVEPVQRLNGGLLVYRNDGRMLGQIQIQTDDVSGFGFEIGESIPPARLTRLTSSSSLASKWRRLAMPANPSCSDSFGRASFVRFNSCVF
jgi:hypothetical protein